VDYVDDIEMSDRAESSDDDVEDLILNFEINFRQERGGAAGGDDRGGDDSGANDSDDGEDEEEEQRCANILGKPMVREPNYPTTRGLVD
jgi:hypothetical protein